MRRRMSDDGAVEQSGVEFCWPASRESPEQSGSQNVFISPRCQCCQSGKCAPLRQDKFVVFRVDIMPQTCRSMEMAGECDSPSMRSSHKVIKSATNKTN